MTRKGIGFLVAVVAGVGMHTSSVLATPSSGFSGTTIAAGTFGELQLYSHTLPADFWQARLKTKGLSDLFVQSNVWAPAGTTGWHTHPGPSLIIVTAGTVTAYDGDDPACAPHVYTQGATFVDPGDGHVHLIRNETSSEARTVAVQLIPSAAARRIDAAAPGNCPF